MLEAMAATVLHLLLLAHLLPVAAAVVVVHGKQAYLRDLLVEQEAVEMVDPLLLELLARQILEVVVVEAREQGAQ
jgi:hypothetical protein